MHFDDKGMRFRRFLQRFSVKGRLKSYKELFAATIDSLPHFDLSRRSNSWTVGQENCGKTVPWVHQWDLRATPTALMGAQNGTLGAGKCTKRFADTSFLRNFKS